MIADILNLEWISSRIGIFRRLANNLRQLLKVVNKIARVWCIKSFNEKWLKQAAREHASVFHSLYDVIRVACYPENVHPCYIPIIVDELWACLDTVDLLHLEWALWSV